MISKKCDLDEFIEAVKDKPYHEFLTLTLKEGYASDDILVRERNEGADPTSPAFQKIERYNKAITDLIFLLQVGETPDFESETGEENFQKFRSVAEDLVEKGELLPAILDHFGR